MAFDHATWGTVLGMALRAARVFEGEREESIIENGGTQYLVDLINTALPDGVQANGDAKTAALAALKTLDTSLLQAHSTWMDGQEDWLSIFLQTLTSISAADLAAGWVDYVYDAALEASGEISIQKAIGLLPAVARIMTADAKVVQENVITLGALGANPANVGSAVESSIVKSEYMLDGTIVFTCIDDTIGKTIFTVENQLSPTKYPKGLVRQLRNQSDVKRITEVKNLTLGRLFQGGETGLKILIGLDTIAITDPNPNPPFTLVTITSPEENDSDKGKYYIFYQHIRVGAGPDPNWIITWYRGAPSVNTLVQTVPIVGEAPVVPFSFAGANGTVIAGSFDTGKANTDYPALNALSLQDTFDIRNPRQGDIFTKTVANNEAGNFQAKTARRYPFSFPSDVAASAEYAQGKAASLSVS